MAPLDGASALALDGGSALFATMDANGDGVISRDEYEAAMGARAYSRGASATAPVRQVRYSTATRAPVVTAVERAPAIITAITRAPEATVMRTVAPAVSYSSLPYEAKRAVSYSALPYEAGYPFSPAQNQFKFYKDPRDLQFDEAYDAPPPEPQPNWSMSMRVPPPPPQPSMSHIEVKIQELVQGQHALRFQLQEVKDQVHENWQDIQTFQDGMQASGYQAGGPAMPPTRADLPMGAEQSVTTQQESDRYVPSKVSSNARPNAKLGKQASVVGNEGKSMCCC